MEDEKKSKEQLIKELQVLNERVQNLERSKAECKRMEREIGRQTQFLNLVLESIPHPFYVVDASDYTIKLANSAARAGPLSKGTTCHALTHRSHKPCGLEGHPCPLAMVKETKRPVMVEHIHYDEKGNPINVEVHGFPILDADGNVTEMIESCMDITERKQAEEALKKSSEEIKFFAYSTAHDLRSPAVGIYGLTKRLHEGYGHVLDARAKRYCEQILEASRQIALLVSNINMYISTKETPLTVENISLGEILQMVKEEFSPQLDIRQVKWSQPQSIPEILGDRLSFVRIFRNLVENALKYGGDGFSEVKIGYENSDEFHILSVSNNGAAIKPQVAEKIFEPFQRDEASEGVEGLGLGLAIVKALAQQHRGDVRIESVPESGTTFYVSISKAL